MLNQPWRAGRGGLDERPHGVEDGGAYGHEHVPEKGPKSWNDAGERITSDRRGFDSSGGAQHLRQQPKHRGGRDGEIVKHFQCGPQDGEQPGHVVWHQSGDLGRDGQHRLGRRCADLIFVVLETRVDHREQPREQLGHQVPPHGQQVPVGRSQAEAGPPARRPPQRT